MVARNYREFSREQSPPWLLRHYGERFVGVFSLMCDLLAEGATRAVKSSWLATQDVPDDALLLLGEERLMPRYPGESNQRYRARLLGAWDAWAQPGTRTVIGEQLAAFGFPSVHIVANYEWNWPEQAERDNWSRFWVYFPAGEHPIVDDGIWGGPDHQGRAAVWSDGGTWDSSITLAQIEALWAIIDHWKAAEEICVDVVLQMTPGTFTEPTVFSGTSISLARPS